MSFFLPGILQSMALADDNSAFLTSVAKIIVPGAHVLIRGWVSESEEDALKGSRSVIQQRVHLSTFLPFCLGSIHIVAEKHKTDLR